MRRFTTVISCVAAAMAVATPLHSQQPNNVKTFMHAKLEHSQKVLESLATEDFKGLRKHSQEMSLLSQAAQWQVLQTREYLRHSREFRRNADALTKAGQEKNLDGAVLAFVQLTMNCVNCHKYVRNTRAAGRDRKISVR